MPNFKLDLRESMKQLQDHPWQFMTLFQHGTLEVELYQPYLIDHQEPHTRDEVYIIASGSATFHLEGVQTSVSQGDFLFAPAQKEHRFDSFSEDFSTWVLFYGPVGGEKGQIINHQNPEHY